jgi:hypothetical protein
MRALHVAASNNEIDVFNYLLTFPEIDVNVRTRVSSKFLSLIELTNHVYSDWRNPFAYCLWSRER